MKIEAFINGVPWEDITEKERNEKVKKMLKKAAASIGMQYIKTKKEERKM